MNRKLFGMLGREGSEIQTILRRSSRAVCGAFEREIVVRNSEVATTQNKLRNSGYIIVGTGRAGPNSTKIWFNPAGVNL